MPGKTNKMRRAMMKLRKKSKKSSHFELGRVTRINNGDEVLKRDLDSNFKKDNNERK